MIAIGENAAIVAGRGVATIPTETDLTDMNNPVAETDQTESTVQIKWIELNVLTVLTVGIAPSDLTVPAEDAIDRSELLPSRLVRISAYPTKAREPFRSSREPLSF